MIIIHIVDSETWKNNKGNSQYFGDSLSNQGFIHCCLPEQVDDVLKNWFPGREDLTILEIDTKELSSRLEFENLEGGEEKFPHIYGPINNKAIISWYPFGKKDDHGKY